METSFPVVFFFSARQRRDRLDRLRSLDFEGRTTEQTEQWSAQCLEIRRSCFRWVTQDGAPKIAFSWFISGLTMVYGRYNELVFMGIRMVYKPTYNLGAPSCVCA